MPRCAHYHLLGGRERHRDSLCGVQLSKTTVRSIAEQLNILFGYDFTDTNNKAVLKTVVSRVLDEREPKRERDEPLKLPPKKAPRTEEKKTPAKEESDDEEGDEEEDEEGEEGEDDSESEEKPKRHAIFAGVLGPE